MRIHRKVPRASAPLTTRMLDVDALENASGGARIGQGEGWLDWGRRQLPGDWRTDEQKGNDFKAWDDWNRANGLPGAFGEEPRLKGNETFLNPKEVTQDNLWGPFPEELQGLKDLRDGPPDGSRHPLHPETVKRLDEFIKDAETNQDRLDIRSFGRPEAERDRTPPADTAPPGNLRVEAPQDGGIVPTSAAAQFEGGTGNEGQATPLGGAFANAGWNGGDNDLGGGFNGLEGAGAVAPEGEPLWSGGAGNVSDNGDALQFASNPVDDYQDPSFGGVADTQEASTEYAAAPEMSTDESVA